MLPPWFHSPNVVLPILFVIRLSLENMRHWEDRPWKWISWHQNWSFFLVIRCRWSSEWRKWSEWVAVPWVISSFSSVESVVQWTMSVMCIVNTVSRRIISMWGFSANAKQCPVVWIRILRMWNLIVVVCMKPVQYQPSVFSTDLCCFQSLIWCD